MDKFVEVACSADIDNEEIEEVVYDYMKYANTRKMSKYGKLSKSLKCAKSVSFKRVVEIFSFTENWKMQMVETELSKEEEQSKRLLKKRNY